MKVCIWFHTYAGAPETHSSFYPHTNGGLIREDWDDEFLAYSDIRCAGKNSTLAEARKLQKSQGGDAIGLGLPGTTPCIMHDYMIHGLFAVFIDHEEIE